MYRYFLIYLFMYVYIYICLKHVCFLVRFLVQLPMKVNWNHIRNSSRVKRGHFLSFEYFYFGSCLLSLFSQFASLSLQRACLGRGFLSSTILTTGLQTLFGTITLLLWWYLSSFLHFNHCWCLYFLVQFRFDTVLLDSEW